MNELTDGKILLTEPYEWAIITAVNNLLSMRKLSGQYADWDLLIHCTENGSKIKMEVTRIDLYPPTKVVRPK